ncbi:hypothetical protein NOGI109294_18255 [Nocardiopsis gilva]
MWLLPTGLVVAALASGILAVVGPPPNGPFGVPLIVPVLLAAAFAARVLPGRIGAGIGLLAVVIAVAAAIRFLGADLVGDRSVVEVAVGLVQFAGLGAAAYAAVRQLIARRSDAEGRSHDASRPAQIIGLLGMCAIGAELLAAYDDSTGDPGAVAFALIFFGALYGAPALLARDLVRRCGWGWPSLLLLFAALGTAQACLIDQSMFSVDYQGYEGWQETRQATLIPALGIGATNAYNFIVGHVIYSFAAPVALAEAWVPRRARQPWLGPIGTVVAVLAYGGAAALILSDPESRSGTPPQLAVSAGMVAAFIAAAALIGRRRASGSHRTTEFAGRLPVGPVFAIALLAAVIPALSSEGWGGVLVSLAVTGGFGIAILVTARTRGWSLRHSAVVAFAFLLVRGLLAFTYFPLIGDVAPVPKYAHNTILILVVVATGWLAVRRGAGDGRKEAAHGS